jgi:retron-type reverse transcriptase
MGIATLLKRVVRYLLDGAGDGIDELACRLDMSESALREFRPRYREFQIPKRSGGSRRILAPEEELKNLQRRILHRLLRRLKVHPAARGFEHGQSIVTNALPHIGKPVVVRMDLKDFFPSTQAARVYKYFRKIGWNRPASHLLVRLCTHDGGLPQGAPTSPRLSNLVNYRMDAQLARLKPRFVNPRGGQRMPALGIRVTYTRYADDLTFSFSLDRPKAIRNVIIQTKFVVAKAGYRLHLRKKLQIRRQHAQQRVTGLIVNRRVNLPRKTRRWLRAVEHRVATGQAATLTPAQLAGWRAFEAMVKRQRELPSQSP